MATLLLLTNAMNFIDGLDGLLAGVAFISAVAAFAFSLYAFRESNNAGLAQSPFIVLALAGACLGFLPHNFFRAKVFMGDSGSMFIGLAMAAAITSTAAAANSAWKLPSGFWSTSTPPSNVPPRMPI